MQSASSSRATYKSRSERIPRQSQTGEFQGGKRLRRTATNCKCGAPWAANLGMGMLAAELNAPRGIPVMRLNWQPVKRLAKCGTMAGNNCTIGAIGRIVLRLRKTTGQLPSACCGA